MNKDAQIKQYRQKCKDLMQKNTELEQTIARLQADDSSYEQRIDNLNKLHAQKVRALMKSIQELKKQSALLQQQTKEHKRSDLIEKLKSDIGLQEVSIDALRALINDDERCDTQIINYLNKGPPRVRPMSREEMRIEIRKLKSQVQRLRNRKAGDQAVKDLDKMMNQDEFGSELDKPMDPLHNEKIVELLEEIENLRLDIRGKDQSVNYYKTQMLNLQNELKVYQQKETEWQIEGVRKGALETETSRLKAELNNGTISVEFLQQRIEQLQTEYAALQQNYDQLKRKCEQLQEQLAKSASGTNQEAIRLRKEITILKTTIAELEDNLNNQGRNSNEYITKYRKIIQEQEETIQTLSKEIEQLKQQNQELNTIIYEKDDHIDRLMQQISGSRLQDSGSTEIELEVLRTKLNNLNGPNGPLAQEKQESNKLRQQIRALMAQIIELEDRIEELESQRNLYRYNQEQQDHATDLVVKGPLLIIRDEKAQIISENEQQGFDIDSLTLNSILYYLCPASNQQDQLNRLQQWLEQSQMFKRENQRMIREIEEQSRQIQQYEQMIDQLNSKLSFRDQQSKENEAQLMLKLEEQKRKSMEILEKKQDILKLNNDIKVEIEYQIRQIVPGYNLFITKEYKNQVLLSRSRQIKENFKSMLGSLHK